MNRCLKHLLLALSGIVLATVSSLDAEDITTLDGQVYPNTTLRRSGSMILVKIQDPGSTTMIEMGIPITRIAKVGFAEPPELAKAMDAASKGNAQQVLDLTAEYVKSQDAYKDIPGSWWPQMAGLRLLALASVGKYAEAADLARAIGATKAPGSDSLAKGGALFGSLATSDHEAVVVGAKGLPAVGGDQGSALAQLALGQALYMKKDYPGALRAFLTIEVFYPSVGLLQPPALMGAANSYEGLGDKPRAIDTYDRIVSDWMNSPQVSEAKKKSQILSHS